MQKDRQKFVVLFDGVCHLCNRSVQFIIKRDKKERFVFAPLQGIAGRELLREHNLPAEEMKSFILIEQNKAYSRSTGALRVCKHLGSGWQLLYGFIIVPRFIRDAIYNWVARNRYKWFGKRESCRIPAPEERARFLD